MAAALFCRLHPSAHAAGKFLCPVAIAARVRGPRHRPLLSSLHMLPANFFAPYAEVCAIRLCLVALFGGSRVLPPYFFARAPPSCMPANIFVLWFFLPLYFFARALRVAVSVDQHAITARGGNR